MTCDELRSDYLLYVLGEIDEPERSEIGAHLARGCPACTTGLREARTLAYSMGASLEGPEPSPSLRRRVLAIPNGDRRRPARAAAAERQGGFWFRPMPLWQGFAAACAVLLLASVPAFFSYRQLSNANASEAAALAREQRLSASLHGQIARLEAAGSDTARAVPVFSLELMRSAGAPGPVKELPIPRGTPAVVLALPIDLVRQASRMELRNGSGETVWATDLRPQPDSDAAGLTIPSRLLTAGTYSVVLRSGDRNVAELAFRVARPD